MAYVYLKATEGGDRIDERYERNIELAHRYGLKVGSYHFFRPKKYRKSKTPAEHSRAEGKRLRPHSPAEAWL